MAALVCLSGSAKRDLMMRICSPQLGIAPQATLGGEVYDRETLVQLAALGAEVEILLPAGLSHPSVPNWRVTRLPWRRGYRWFISNLVFVPYIGRVYRQRPFHILRVHSLRFTGLAAIWARQLYRLPVPIVMHHHHLDIDRRTHSVDKRSAQQGDLIITVSQFAKSQLITELNIDSDKIKVVYNGVNQQYRPSPSPHQAKQMLGLDGKKSLLHVGSLIPRKNLLSLLQTFAQLHTTYPQTYLVLMGRGSQEAELRAKINELDIEQSVKLVGFVSEEKKIAYYQAADLFVSTSLMEGFGLAIAEAMACGIPVVATQVGSIPEVVSDGKTGLLVPVNNNQALYQAIARLIENSQLAQQMGQAGQNRVEALFRWDVAGQHMLDLYRGLL
jgi:glycosyltransferase involved in cell wall biosynthesis